MEETIANNTVPWEVLKEISTLSDRQEITLSLASVFSSLLSIFGSCTIVWHVRRHRGKASLKTPYGRLLLGLSLSDIISSTAFLLSPFLLPHETSPRVWAVGNDLSCSFLGFWTQLANLAYWYNGLLSLYYFLTIRRQMQQRYFARKVEPYLHVMSVTFFLFSATAGAAVGMYSEIEVGQGCWIGEYPAGCEARGDCIGHYFGWVFSALPNLLVMVTLPFANLSIFLYVRKVFRKTLLYCSEFSSVTSSTTGTSQPQLSRGQARRLNEVATQGFLYVGSFYLSYTTFFVLRALEGMGMDAYQEAQYFPILFLSALLAPLQGFFNVFIFVRPNYNALRDEFPELSRFWAWKQALLVPDIASFTTTYRSSQNGCLLDETTNRQSTDRNPTSCTEQAAVELFPPCEDCASTIRHWEI